jgi:hypothetical protein
VYADGASNEVAAATFDGFCKNAEHIWCIVHQLNLVVGDAYAGRCRSRASKDNQEPEQEPALASKSSKQMVYFHYSTIHIYILGPARFCQVYPRSDSVENSTSLCTDKRRKFG